MRVQKPYMIIFTFLITMLVTTSACSVRKPNEEHRQNESVTVKLLWNSTVEIQPIETEVGKEIEKQTGVRLEIVSSDEEKYKVMLVAGDLPDMIIAKPSYFKQLIQGQNVISLDELLKNKGENVLKTIPDALEFSKKFWSNGQNKVYFLPTNCGIDDMGFEATLGAVVRWDYYKELGYPPINNEDELLKVLADMVKNHPVGDDGKKVYGVASWNDWGLWPYYLPMAVLYGYNNSQQPGYVYTCDTNEIVNNYLNPDSPLWKTVKFYYKANRLGILDPDSLIMKYADYQAKAVNGRILYSPATWTVTDANGKLNKEGKGYAALPLDWGYQWNGGNWICGWFDKSFAITKNAGNAEKCMELINYLWSYEGSRVIRSGIKGVNWDISNGRPVLKDETIKLKAQGGTRWKKTGIGSSMFINLVGLSGFSVNPEDEVQLDLFNSTEAYASQLNPFYKEYTDYYKVEYPAKIFLNKIKEGKAKNQKNMDVRITAAINDVPEDIKKIDAKLDDIISKEIAKAIVSESDSQFEAIKGEAIQKLRAEGGDISEEWWFNAWKEAKKLVGVN